MLIYKSVKLVDSEIKKACNSSICIIFVFLCVQPISRQVRRVLHFCLFRCMVHYIAVVLCLASIFHLLLISADRFVPMKFSLR